MTANVSEKGFIVCLLLFLAATLLINLLSSYIRHTEAGLGCATWPDCYGLVGHLVTEAGEAPAAMHALTPADTAKRTHRTIATMLVVLLLVVVVQARKVRLEGFARQLPYLMAGVTLLLAVIGPASYLKTLPAIATVNLLGGMALLALAWWLWAAHRAPALSDLAPLPRGLTRATLGIVIAQIVLGAWVSANFAGTACRGVSSCEGLVPPSGSLWGAAWYLRELALDEAGRVIVDQTQVAIHVVHRMGALAATVLVGWLAVVAIRASGAVGRWGVCLVGLLAIQISLGLFAVTYGLPLVIVLAHSLVASLLLLVVIRLNMFVRLR
jgi:cytochrome c oxidase assembly protein subunit 15